MGYRSIDPEEEYEHCFLWDYVYQRDNEMCQLCGAPGGEQHHVISRGRRGITKASNLILLCHTCHRGGNHNFSQTDTEKMLFIVRRNESRFRQRMI